MSLQLSVINKIHDVAILELPPGTIIAWIPGADEELHGHGKGEPANYCKTPGSFLNAMQVFNRINNIANASQF